MTDLERKAREAALEDDRSHKEYRSHSYLEGFQNGHLAAAKEAEQEIAALRDDKERMLTLLVRYKARQVELNKESAALLKNAAAAPDMLNALRTVLLHVEDEKAERVGNQCTLCYSHRKIMRDAISKAEGCA